MREVRAHKPGVAIVEIPMPPDNTDDGRAAALIREELPGTGFLILPVRRGARRGRPALGRKRGVGYLLIFQEFELGDGSAAGHRRVLAVLAYLRE